jgi:hypothetical protein
MTDATWSLPLIFSREASRSSWLRQNSVTQMTSGSPTWRLTKYQLAAGVALEIRGGGEQQLGERLAAPLAGDGLPVARHSAHAAPHGTASEEGGLRPPYR